MTTIPVAPPDRSIVERYLPADLARLVARQDPSLSPDRLLPSADHLSALLRAICSYVPQNIVAEQLETPIRGRVVGRYLDGTTLFADVSGFTAMSERLSTLGKVGAEEITRIVNDLFTTLLDVIAQYGGWLFKFGGDALTVFFHGEHHAWRAASAALDMQRAMVRFAALETLHGTFTLRMSEGAHTGAIFAAEVGTPERIELVVTGANINETAEAESAANATQAFITGATLAQLGDLAVVRESDRFFDLLDLRERAPRVATAPAAWQTAPTAGGILATISRIEALRSYLLAGVYDKIAVAPERVEVEGELRPVTIIFANFADFSEILDRLGPERVDEATAILQRYFAGMATILHQYGGTVNKVDMYTHGDKLMALFGAPVAYENDPERAVRAALEMQAAMHELAHVETTLGAFSLHQKIGINSGTVFAGNVGSPSRKEYTVMGDEVNLAARLMSAAPEHQILTSQSTWRRVRERFVGEALAPVRVKGKANPIPIFRVDRAADQGRHDRAEGGGTGLPLVGRDGELAALQRRAELAVGGQGQVIAVAGEAGTGKSRLVLELERTLAFGASSPLVISGECQSYGQSIAFLPFVGLLRQLFGVAAGDSPDAGAARVVVHLAELAPEHEPFAGLLSGLLSLPIPETDVSQALTPEQRRERAFTIIGTVIARQAERRPVVLVIEDLHWIDSSSLELLDLIVRAAPPSRLLIILLYRPEFRPPWADLAHFCEVRLAELDEAHTLDLVQQLLPLPELPEALRQLILAKTQGNPLFVEEVVKNLVERSIVGEVDDEWRVLGDLAQADIPDSIQGVIMARIDRLEEHNRQLLQVASIIGRRFAFRVLEGVYPLQVDLLDSLESLSRLDLIAREGAADDPTYVFKQAMTQEVAYESLLFSRRRTYHRKVGDRMEDVYADRLLENYELLAYHYEHGEHWRKALEYDLLAGDKARSQFANRVALQYFDRVLEVLNNADKYRLRREPNGHDPALVIPLDLETVWRRDALIGRGDVQELLGDFDQAIESFDRAVPHTEDRRRRADAFFRMAQVYEYRGQYVPALEQLDRALAELGDERECPEGARILSLQARVFARQGKYDAAETAATQSLTMLAGGQSYREMAFGHQVLADVYRSRARYDLSIEHLEQALALIEKLQDLRQMARLYTNLAGTNHYKGDTDAAIAWLTKASETYEKVGEVRGLAGTYNNLGIVHRGRGETTAALDFYQKSLALFEKIGDQRNIAAIHLNLGEILKDQGEHAQAVEHLERGLSIAQEIGANEAVPQFFRQLAEAHLMAGNLTPATELAAQALDQATRAGNRLEQGLASLVLARLHEQLGDWPTAEHAYRESVDVLETTRNEREVAAAAVAFGMALLGRGDPAAVQPLERAAAILAKRGPSPRLDRVQRALADARALASPQCS